MVDPNRKINRLTDKDIEFLDECEEEFAYRFTDEDEEFVKHCSQPVPEPPVVQNWGENKPFNRNSYHNHHSGGDYRSNRRWNNNHRRGGYRPYSDRREHHRGDHRDHRDDHQPRRENWNNSR